jgi:hypothetical protein
MRRLSLAVLAAGFCFAPIVAQAQSDIEISGTWTTYLDASPYRARASRPPRIAVVPSRHLLCARQSLALWVSQVC